MRTDDTSYGRDYWDTLDGGLGYTDSVMWSDIAHIIHELVGVDKQAGTDNAQSIRFLDVGCAFGFLCRHMRRRGYDVRGVDLSEYALEHAPWNIRFYLSHFDLTGEDQLREWFRPFDVITCFETLEHIAPEHALRAVRHLADALQVGGLLIATICVEGQPGWDSDPTHVNVQPRLFWESLFESEGWVPDDNILHQLRYFWLFGSHRGVFAMRKLA